MRYKLLCTDMDGTLLDEKKEISDLTKKVIRKASEKGLKIAVCSGRIFLSSRYYADLLGLNTPVIASNGAYIREKDRDEVIYKSALEVEECKLILDMFKKHGICAHFFTHDTILTEKIIYASKRYSDSNKYMPKDLQIKIEVVKDWEKTLEKYKGNILKAFASDEDIEKIKKAKEDFKKINRFNVVSSYDTNFEIMNRNTSKGRAVKILASFYGIPKEEIICIGDNENDLSMIEYAGLGVAMGNSSDMVKNEADYITDTNEEDGVAKVIKKFVFDS